MTIVNVEMAAAWDGAEGTHWAAQADRYEATGRRYGEALLRAAAVRPGDTILDIGCGTGSSTLALARMAPDGSVLGVDLSAKMLQHAGDVAEREGLTNVSFEQADAQVHPFPERTFDVAVSEFGAMFFADPVAAFANVRRSLVPGGRLILSAWREFAANEWITSLRDALAVGRRFPMPGAGTPGPFGLADRDQTDGILVAAGFEHIRIEKVEEPIFLGADADDAFSFVSTFGMTRGLTHDLDDAGREAALEALHASLRDHETSAGVLFGGSAWLVRASRPG